MTKGPFVADATEEEAMERWCPFARVGAMPGSAEGLTINRLASGPIVAARCVASECMA